MLLNRRTRNSSFQKALTRSLSPRSTMRHSIEEPIYQHVSLSARVQFLSIFLLPPLCSFLLRKLLFSLLYLFLIFGPFSSRLH